MEATRFAAKSFTEFLHKLEVNQPIPDSALSDLLTYDRFGLRSPKRQPGLRQLDNEHLFALAAMQSHCGQSPAGYQELKPFIEMRLSEPEV